MSNSDFSESDIEINIENLENIETVETLSIITNEWLESLNHRFDPLFANVKIYGTVKNPLFNINDIAKTLKIPDLNLRHKNKKYVEGRDYMIRKLNTIGGLQPTKLFTELGLYKVLMHSDVEIAYEYCRFTMIVMQELRTARFVTMDGALKQLEKELMHERNERIRMENTVDEMHEKMQLLQINDANNFSKRMKFETSIAQLKRENDDYELCISKCQDPEYIEALEKRFLKPVKIYTSPIGEDGENQDHETDDLITFKLSTNELKTYTLVDTVLMVNPLKQIKEICENGNEITTSLTDLKYQIHNNNLKFLTS
jgi:prophage antirepressor-like protein